jgi:hypothetical protein
MGFRKRKWNYLNRKWNYLNRKWNYLNRKWNYLNRKWNYFSPFQSSDNKTSLTKVFPFSPTIPNWVSEQEMELSKQEMELFRPFSVVGSKNLFYKSIPIWSNDFKMVFRNRKWHYLNRKWNYFSPFQSLDQKTSLTKVFPISATIPKWVSETGNGII